MNKYITLIRKSAVSTKFRVLPKVMLLNQPRRSTASQTHNNTLTNKEKFAIEIEKSQCRRETSKYMTNTADFERNMQRHGWCARYCQVYCMRSAAEDCMNEHSAFCKQNCIIECYHTGSPIPHK